MAYIAPNSTIKLLQDVPLDNTYNHTIYFASKQAQSDYFAGKVLRTFNEHSYVRINRGRIRLQTYTENVYTCNYLMFQNTAFGDKWFYAFIKSCEYVNNITTEFEFEIDVMQTWMFDYTLGECFVEREHAITDSPGDNLQPEPVACGEYVFNNYDVAFNLSSDMGVVIAIVDTGDDGKFQGATIDGVFCGTLMFGMRSNNVAGILDKLNEYSAKPDSVISIYTCPWYFIGGGTAYDGVALHAKGYATSPPSVTYSISTGSALDGYVPHNKKLLTYPYTFLHVDNSCGDSLALRYEFGDIPGQISLECLGTVTQPVQAILRPFYYKGSGVNTLNTETLTLSNFPLCSWGVDSYQAFIAQNDMPMKVDIVQGVTSTLGRAATGALFGASGGLAGVAVGALGNAIGGAVNTINSITDNMTSEYQASIKADVLKGNVSSGNINVSHGKHNFYAGRVSIVQEQARKFDEFFSMFGYATNKVKIPNTHHRAHWNFVKTKGCVAKGSIPADDMAKICHIYDNGLTFWNNGDEVGNYTLDNDL